MDGMKLGKRIMGPASCTLSDSEVLPGIIELSSLDVPIYHRKKGAANKLMNAICEEADKARKVLMLMPADSEWLVKWYESHGFEQIQADPLIMARRPY
jgi:N-acetylglutamate synthase-like GNAT family acetyltransferase